MNKQLAALVLVAAAVAGCGSTTSTASTGAASGVGSSASPAPSGSPDPMQTQPAAGGTIRALPTAAKPLPSSAKPLSLPWRFLRMTDGGKKVEISLQYGGCTAFNYVQVVQGSKAVQLTVWGSTSASTKAICPAFEAIINGTVTLDAPLGSRQLLHGLVSLNHGLPRQ
jgi:hypothetical protein